MNTEIERLNKKSYKLYKTEVFQKFDNMLFGNIEDTFIDIDEILIFGETLEIHN